MQHPKRKCCHHHAYPIFQKCTFCYTPMQFWAGPRKFTVHASLHFANITRQYCVSKILKFFPFHDCIKSTRRKYRDVERVLATLMLVIRRTTTRMIADVNASERGNVRAGMRILYYILLVELCSSMLCTISIAAMLLLNDYHIIPLVFFCTHIQMQHKLTALL
jgi:hypothetical protein